ncbi:DUF4328 domain-containing protein [Nocardia sp. NPDC050712]|uniref:DUF4328 domain-containing protein n=1 Tax=Nocardia sp. NPDC050712 TaxID=3155518 RepID=UPI003407B2C9
MNTDFPTTARPLRTRAILAATAGYLALIGPIIMVTAIMIAINSDAGRDSPEADRVVTMLAAGAVVIVLSWPLLLIPVILWTVRARSNAEALYPATHRLSRGWAIAGWFIPIANLILPLVVIADIARATGSVPRTVWTWWFGWLAATIVFWGAIVAAGRTEWPDSARIVSQGMLAGVALYVVAVVALSSFVRTVARRQDQSLADRTTHT